VRDIRVRGKTIAPDATLHIVAGLPDQFSEQADANRITGLPSLPEFTFLCASHSGRWAGAIRLHVCPVSRFVLVVLAFHVLPEFADIAFIPVVGNSPLSRGESSTQTMS